MHTASSTDSRLLCVGDGTETQTNQIKRETGSDRCVRCTSCPLTWRARLTVRVHRHLVVVVVLVEVPRGVQAWLACRLAVVPIPGLSRHR